MLPFITVFGKDLSTYALMSLIGLFASGIYICRKARKFKYDDNNFIIIILLSCIGVFLGGHLLYGITQIDKIIKIVSNWSCCIKSFSDFYQYFIFIFGGSVFYGGLIGGISLGLFYIKKKKYNLADYSDIIAPGIPLFHFFGRIGCFLGGCCFGIECSFGFTAHGNELIPLINDIQRFPVQLLEAGLNLVLFFVLSFLLNKNKFKGGIFALYLLIYSVIRFFDEFLRGDTYRGFLFGFSTSQIISIFLFITSLAILILRSKKLHKNNLKKAD